MEREVFTEFPEGLIGGIYELVPDGKRMEMYDRSTTYLVNTENGISLDEIFAMIIYDDGDDLYTLLIQLKPGVEEKLADMTSRNLGQPMALVFNDVVFMAPVVNQQLVDSKFEIGFDGVGFAKRLEGILSGKQKPPVSTLDQDPEEVKKALSITPKQEN